MIGNTEPLKIPFRIAVDTREQLPYTFEGIHADARQGGRPLLIETAERSLPSGDYSVVGFEHAIAVERKSLADLFGTLGQQRERFERELERLANMHFAAVVVEADWYTVLADPPVHSRLNPKTVYRSVIAWQQRYTCVHWWFVHERRLAEVTTFRILERFYKENKE